MEARLSALFIYPVKSLRGVPVAAAELDELGLVGDRRFLVVDLEGKFVTQRAIPRMALVATALGPDGLGLSAEGCPSITVHPSERGAARRVAIWKSEGLLAADCGDGAAGWLSEVLQVGCRLVHAGPEFVRAMPGGYRVAFPDEYPLLILSEASLQALNDRLIERGQPPAPVERFRPNFVVSGVQPHEEDRWNRLSIGGVAFRSGGPCARCVITATDPWTGARGHEPLRTLGEYRRDPQHPSKVNFAQNLVPESLSGRIELGGRVEVLQGGA